MVCWICVFVWWVHHCDGDHGETKAHRPRLPNHHVVPLVGLGKHESLEVKVNSVTQARWRFVLYPTALWAIEMFLLCWHGPKSWLPPQVSGWEASQLPLKHTICNKDRLEMDPRYVTMVELTVSGMCYKSGVRGNVKRGAQRCNLDSELLGGLPFGQAGSWGHMGLLSSSPEEVWVSLLETTQEDIIGLEVSTVRLKELEQEICFTIIKDYLG